MKMPGARLAIAAAAIAVGAMLASCGVKGPPTLPPGVSDGYPRPMPTPSQWPTPREPVEAQPDATKGAEPMPGVQQNQ